MRKIFLVSIGLLTYLGAFSQIDLTDTVDFPSTQTQKNAEIIAVDDAPIVAEEPDTAKKHSPRTAAILSAVIPGSGQIYNGSWWKTPIVYAGFAGLGYGLYFYQDYYKSYKTTYDNYRNPYLEQGLTPPTDTILTVRGETGYSPVNVQQGRDFYRKYRDLCVIGVAVWYFVNILDAYTEAHLFEFDVSDDLSIRCEPAFYYKPICATTPSPLPSGMKVTMKF